MELQFFRYFLVRVESCEVWWISLLFGLFVIVVVVVVLPSGLSSVLPKLCLYFTGCSDSTDPVLSQISENPLTTSFQAPADPQWTYQYPSCDGGSQKTQNNVLNDWRIKHSLSGSPWVLLQDRPNLSSVLVQTSLDFGHYLRLAAKDGCISRDETG